MATADGVEIRSAQAGDALALSQLLGQLGFPAAADVVTTRLQSMGDCGELILVAARDDGSAVGFASIHVTPVLHRPTPVGRVTALVVDGAYRGRGVGRALMAAAERELAARGCALLEVTSNHRLEAAHAFYRHIGYEETSRRFKKSLVPAE